MGEQAQRNEYVQAFERGLAVIRAFNGSPMTLSEVARTVDMPPAAVRRYLGTLTGLGYFTHDAGRFAPGEKLVELSAPYVAANDSLQRALPILQELTERIDETTTLTHLKGHDVVNVLDVQTAHELAIQVIRGRTLPAYCTAMGRAMLSLLPENGAAEVLRGVPLERRTARTITSIDAILEQVHLARSRGYALVEEEHTSGIRTMSMAFRLPSGQLAAFSAPTPTARESRAAYVNRVEDPLRNAVAAMQGRRAQT